MMTREAIRAARAMPKQTPSVIRSSLVLRYYNEALDTAEAHYALRERVKALHFKSGYLNACAHCGGAWPCMTRALLTPPTGETR